MRLPLTVLALVTLAAGAAHAQEQGWYASGGLGPIGMHDSKVTPPPSGGATYQVGHRIGAVAQVSLGYQWNQFRLEDELSYSNIQGDVWSPAGHTIIGTDMINLLWQAPLDERWSFEIGAGAGAARVAQDYTGILAASRVRFAWQGIAGVSYIMAPGADLFLDYHHREIMGGNYVSPNPALNPSTVSAVVTDGGTLGVRWYLLP